MAHIPKRAMKLSSGSLTLTHQTPTSLQAPEGRGTDTTAAPDLLHSFPAPSTAEPSPIPRVKQSILE